MSFVEREPCISTVCSCASIGSDPDNIFTCKVHTSALENWSSWRKKRKRIYQYLSWVLQRPAGDLVMNYGDYLFYINEEKMVLDYAKIPTNFDKYRGNPAFWKTPFGLKDKRYPKKDPIYLSHMTKLEQNIVPEISLTFQTNLIENENGLIPRTRNIYKRWQNTKYRIQQMQHFRSKVDLILPHRPEPSFLCVGKHNVVCLKQEVKKTIETVISLQQVMSDISKTSRRSTVIEVSDLTYKRKSSKTQGLFSSSSTRLMPESEVENQIDYLIFESEVTDPNPCGKNIIFRNTGVVTLRFNFTQVNDRRRFPYIKTTFEDRNSAFFFDKNVLLVPPTKSVTLPVWFQSKTTGMFTETWNVTIEPTLEKFCLTIIMLGVASNAKCKEKMELIREKLDRDTKKKIVRDILDKIYENLKYTDRYIPEQLAYCETQAFEAVNNGRNAFRIHSDYIYQDDIIRELKTFYKEVRQEHHPVEWNLSIRDLKKMTKERDILDYVDRQKEMFVKGFELREKQAQTAAEEYKRRLQEDTYWIPQSIDKDKKKKQGKKDKPGKKKKDTDKKSKDSKKGKDKKDKKGKKDTPTEPKMIETMLELPETRIRKLENILRKMEKPATIINRERIKHNQAFVAIRAYFTRMSIELSYLDDEYGAMYYETITEPIDPSAWRKNIPERRIYERFDDIYVPRTKRVMKPETSLPKTELLKDIPPDDFELIQKIYFGKVEKNKKEKIDDKKGKKGKDKKAKTQKTSKIKEKKSVSNLKPLKKIDDSIIENFDPYSEKFFVPHSPAPSMVEVTKVREEILQLQKDHEVDHKSTVSMLRNILGPYGVQEGLSVANSAISNVSEYRSNMYIIIYFNLIDAVDAMIDTLESCKLTYVLSDVIEQVEESAYHNKNCVFDSAPPDAKSVSALSKGLSFQSQASVWDGNDQEQFRHMLVNKHWRHNLRTKQYYIEGITKASKFDAAEKQLFSFLQEKRIPYEETESTITQEVEEIPTPTSTSEPKFQDVSIEPMEETEPFKSKEQTLVCAKSSTEESIESISSEKDSLDIYYYVDDEDIKEDDFNYETPLSVLIHEINNIDD